MSNDTKALSPEAQKLVELTCKSGGWQGWEPDEKADIAAILQANPDLLSGLNEYVAWRQRLGMIIAEKKMPGKIGHGLASVAKKIKPPKKR